ncbi:hypothetical protein GCM10011378_39340 [Hymenobacter glacieicola]|uniref:Uncharacterized protein n=1 Tax=Hymenobacter glacieicola TaxID=1562124 RepID=A0ABQ1X7C9_9BACT|nr:hypothetical protein GCM10011378_39340 [Hymenobacter glacieicola]
MLQAGNLLLPAAVFSMDFNKQNRVPLFVKKHHIRAGKQPPASVLLIKWHSWYARLHDEFRIFSDVDVPFSNC